MLRSKEDVLRETGLVLEDLIIYDVPLKKEEEWV